MTTGLLLGFSSASAEITDFSDLPLASESFWNGPDPDGTNVPGEWDSTVRVGSFQSGNVQFVNRYNLTFESWSGFAYSNTTDTSTPGYTNQHSAFVRPAGGSADNNQYGVASGYLDVLDPSDPSQLEKLSYFELPAGSHLAQAFVTNTTYAALSMRDGDSFAKKFGGESRDDADWFKLTAYGTDAAGSVLAHTVEFFLADYRNRDNSLDYVIADWTALDLSPLADARRVYFNLASSDNSDWGMNTPAYFAIDNITFTTAPEPSAFLLAAIGSLLAAAVFIRRGR
ncbi:MAG: DUF4465 domain-containing protein [Pirellulaceae bacterium]